MIHKDTFDFHVDAKHFNFMWTGPMYINVQYSAWMDGGTIKYTIDNITAPAYLIGSVVLNGSWWSMDVEMNAAALDHATKHFNRNTHVNETILGSIAAHITH